MQEKIEVHYTFSPLRGRSHFDSFCATTQKLGDDFPELRISCMMHSNTFEETVKIDGFVDKEKEEDFLARIAYLKSIE